MKFDDLDTKMRCYEQSVDQHILPDMYLVARLDGRGLKADLELPIGERYAEYVMSFLKQSCTAQSISSV